MRVLALDHTMEFEAFSAPGGHALHSSATAMGYSLERY